MPPQITSQHYGIPPLKQKKPQPPRLPSIGEQLRAQDLDVVKAVEVRGFPGLRVTITLEKKTSRKPTEERKRPNKERNEDCVIADSRTGLFGVADGLGEAGTGSGALASKALEKHLPDCYLEALEKMKESTPNRLKQLLVKRQLMKFGGGNKIQQQEVEKAVNEMIAVDIELAQKSLALLAALYKMNDLIRATGGKTTACIGLKHKGFILIANIGDSGAFKERADGSIVLLTQEDSFANILLEYGTISQAQLKAMKAEPEKIFPIEIPLDLVKVLPDGKDIYDDLVAQGKTTMKASMDYKRMKRMMVAALGSDLAHPTLTARTVRPGEKIRFWTDGGIDNFENADGELDTTKLRAALQGATGEERLDHLREAAKNGPKDDDIAILEVEVLSQ